MRMAARGGGLAATAFDRCRVVIKPLRANDMMAGETGPAVPGFDQAARVPRLVSDRPRFGVAGPAR